MSRDLASAPVIAPATGDDLDAVMVVMEDAFDPQFGEAWTRAQCAGILPMSGVAMTLATDGDRPVGFTLARSVADEAELLLIAVSRAARGRGVGSALIRQFVAESRTRGLQKLHLEVRDGNPAVHVYAHHGFTIHGRRIGYYKGSEGQQMDALTMLRILDTTAS